jgi:hypothetical protein
MTGGGGGGVEPGGGSCKQHQSAFTSFDNSSDFRQFHSYFSIIRILIQNKMLIFL